MFFFVLFFFTLYQTLDEQPPTKTCLQHVKYLQEGRPDRLRTGTWSSHNVLKNTDPREKIDCPLFRLWTSPYSWSWMIVCVWRRKEAEGCLSTQFSSLYLSWRTRKLSCVLSACFSFFFIYDIKKTVLQTQYDVDDDDTRLWTYILQLHSHCSPLLRILFPVPELRQNQKQSLLSVHLSRSRSASSQQILQWGCSLKLDFSQSMKQVQRKEKSLWLEATTIEETEEKNAIFMDIFTV